MRKVERGMSILILYLSLWITISHAKTFSSYGIRFSNACKGFQILEDTNITCAPCSMMCLYQLIQEEKFQPESQGVLVHGSDRQCSQISIDNGQIFCFESDFSDEQTMTILDNDRVTAMSVSRELYITLHFNKTLQFEPISNVPNLLPTAVAPESPIQLAHHHPLTFFNRGMIMCTRTIDKCYHWPFREEIWHEFPTPKKHHVRGSIGVLGNKLIIVGGKDQDNNSTDACEYFDPQTHSWSDGPTLPLALSLLTLVQVSSATIILVGGFSNKVENTTFLLSSGDAQWTQLEDRPQPVYESCCGVVVLGNGRTGALSIGGSYGGTFSSKTYFLDFASMTWSHLPSFTIPVPSFNGFLFQTDTEIHFLPLYEGNFQTRVLKLYSRQTREPDETWESRPYPFGEFTALNVGNPLTPTIYKIPIN